MRGAVQAIVRDAGIAEAQVSIAVVDDATIAKLHQQFLRNPNPTDVLSFTLERSAGILEGEVVVSADTARAAAPRTTPPPKTNCCGTSFTACCTWWDTTTRRRNNAR